MNEITRILSAIEQGDPAAAQELLPLVYAELRQLAGAYMARERPGRTLQPTALVHEAYLRLVDPDAARGWNSRGHFFAAVAQAMRRILVDDARRRHGRKHGGGRERVELDERGLAAPMPNEELLALDQALARLAVEDPVKVRLVELRHFAGMTVEEAAQAIGISTATAKRHWRYAKAWLHREMSGDRTLDDSNDENS